MQENLHGTRRFAGYAEMCPPTPEIDRVRRGLGLCAPVPQPYPGPAAYGAALHKTGAVLRRPRVAPATPVSTAPDQLGPHACAVNARELPTPGTKR